MWHEREQHILPANRVKRQLTDEEHELIKQREWVKRTLQKEFRFKSPSQSIIDRLMMWKYAESEVNDI